jgi:hypothetical protein
MLYTERMARHRIILIPLLVWAARHDRARAWRVVRPLASYGSSANNDCLIYDVRKPVDELAQSPAWKAGIRKGDHLDMTKLGCVPYEPTACGNTLAVLGGRQVRVAWALGDAGHSRGTGPAARQVTLVAEPGPSIRSSALWWRSTRSRASSSSSPRPGSSGPAQAP